MSRPRQILPGTSYLLTRRCTQRQFWLRPSETVNEVFLYCLARAARRTGVLVHAFCVLSNHYHLVVTDPDARLPKFMHWLNHSVARVLNCHHGRWENFWSSEPYSAVRLVAATDILEKIVYTLTNPVAAGLVRTGQDWPGLRSQPGDIGARVFVATRSKFFFRDESLPETVELKLVRPPGSAELDDEDFRELVASRVRAEEASLRVTVDTEGRNFVGPEGVRAQSPAHTPQSHAPQSHAPRRERNPRVAARNKWARIEALQRLVEFVAEYTAALKSFCQGERDVFFPAGTYWMRVHHHVRCAAPT